MTSTPRARRRSSESRSPKATPFEHGTHERSPIVAQLQSGERAARVGVGVRRPLALQVREEQESLDPRLPALGLGQQSRRTGRPGRSCRGATGATPPPRASPPSPPRHREPRDRRRARAHARPCGTRGERRRRRPRSRVRARPGPGPVDPDAERGGLRSPAPAATGMPLDVSPETSGDSRAGGSHRSGISSASSDLLAPAAPGDVEEQRARSVGDVDRPRAGEPEAHVVLGQADARDAGVGVGLVVAKPDDLRGGEAGERSVARELDQAFEADARLDRLALGSRALVVPEDRRAQRRGRSSSSATSPCICPESPIPATSWPAETSASAASAARHQSSGSCSDHPGCGVESG